jgi:hypothetical protein
MPSGKSEVNKVRRRVVGFSAFVVSSVVILGIFFISLSSYLGSFSSQNFACNLASDAGESTPWTCVWYQSAYAVRNWVAGIGVVLIGVTILLSIRVVIEGRRKMLLKSRMATAESVPRADGDTE